MNDIFIFLWIFLTIFVRGVRSGSEAAESCVSILSSMTLRAGSLLKLSADGAFSSLSCGELTEFRSGGGLCFGLVIRGSWFGFCLNICGFRAYISFEEDLLLFIGESGATFSTKLLLPALSLLSSMEL